MSRLTYLHDLIKDGTIILQYLPTTEIAADCLTKPKQGEELATNLASLCLGPVPRADG
jgi:hypothetical protein